MADPKYIYILDQEDNEPSRSSHVCLSGWILKIHIRHLAFFLSIFLSIKIDRSFKRSSNNIRDGNIRFAVEVPPMNSQLSSVPLEI